MSYQKKLLSILLLKAILEIDFSQMKSIAKTHPINTFYDFFLIIRILSIF
jgi:hypothetical protein